MTMLGRIAVALGIAKESTNMAERPQDINSVAKALDTIIAEGRVDLNQQLGVEKEFAVPANNLSIYRTSGNLYTFYSSVLRQSVRNVDGKTQLLSPGDPANDFILSEFWKHEPILAGAVYSMSAKMASLSWTVLGTKRLASYYANILSNAMTMNTVGGGGWGDFVGATAQDFYTANRGSFWATPREGTNLTGRLVELAYMDALACAATGNMRKPVLYSSVVTGQDLFYAPGEYAHFASMMSPREDHFGMGYCAVNRAYKAARILIGLSDYDWEKLNNLPPEGVAAVTGLTKDEFLDSLEIWKAARAGNKSLTYPQVLWLLSSMPNTNVDVKFEGFSQIPESFERKDIIPQYVNTLALDFGVDAREFWPISTGALGTAAESEIQHMKAKGKGPGEFITTIERWMNRETPDDVEFAFDTQDVGEDQIQAAIAKGWIDALMPLYNPGGKGTPPSKTPTGPGVTRPEGGASQTNLSQPEGGGGGEVEPLITKDQLLRLLIDRRVLPGWLVDDNRIIRTDIGLMQKQLKEFAEGDPEAPMAVTWKEGKLKMERQPAYELVAIDGANSGSAIGNADALPLAHSIKENGSSTKFEPLETKPAPISQPNIQGSPIPEREALRGPRVTSNTVKNELELWLSAPELRAYVPTPDEEEYTKVLQSIQEA